MNTETTSICQLGHWLWSIAFVLRRQQITQSFLTSSPQTQLCQKQFSDVLDTNSSWTLFQKDKFEKRGCYRWTDLDLNDRIPDTVTEIFILNERHGRTVSRHYKTSNLQSRYINYKHFEITLQRLSVCRLETALTTISVTLLNLLVTALSLGAETVAVWLRHVKTEHGWLNISILKLFMTY